MKKWIAAISAAVLAVTGMASAIPAATVTAADSKYNYGEALQKSMFFYEVQQSGKKPDWNEVSWRSDCMTNDYVTGGWFDAGDHLKFTLTNAYSAALLGWGLLNYGDGVEKAGQRTMYENNLQFALDYLVGCDQGDNIVYMIGDGSFDHVWWGSAEVYMDKYELMKGETERPYYTCEDSCIQADMAAALCTGYLNFKDSKPEKAKEYLEHAIDLFDRADKLRAIGDDAAEQPYYKITTFYDDLFYAANWLYMATGEQKYLDLCKTDYIPNLGKEEQSSEMKYTWGMCWDDVMQGGVLLYALRGRRKVQLTVWALVIFLCDFVLTFGMACRQEGFVWTQMFTNNYEWFGVAAVVLMRLYNGQRGSGHKQLFYWFYPAHVYLLYGASCLLYNVMR